MSYDIIKVFIWKMFGHNKQIPLNYDTYSHKNSVQDNERNMGKQEYRKGSHKRQESMPEKTYAPKAPLDYSYKV